MRWALSLAVFVGCNGPDKDGADRPGDDDDDTTRVWECALDGSAVGCDAVDSSPQIGCAADFDALASQPIDASIPGARSVKTVLDQSTGDTLYFQNSVKYPIHWDFAYNNLSVAQGLFPVPELAQFNSTEYYSPDRRFVLGAVTFYEGADRWVYEIAPYDTAGADMISKAFDAIRDNAFFGQDLAYRPSSATQETQVADLPDDIPIVTSDELYEGITYQPYNLGTTTGLLTFHTSDEVDGVYTYYRELVVLDKIPNDISIVAGIITGEFQTPLAHINVLSINRGTPNMGLRDAYNDPTLRALEGKWVELTVEPFTWSIREITAEDAESWFVDNLQPDPLTVPPIDRTVTDLRWVEDIVPDDPVEPDRCDDQPLAEDGDPDRATKISDNIRVFGSKGTNYAGLWDVGDCSAYAGMVPIQDAFVIPFSWYLDHMETNGLDLELAAMHAESQWSDPVYREQRLVQLKTMIVNAPLDPELLSLVYDNINSGRFPLGTKVRFRSSTNAEDLGNFTGAGIYDSQTGDPAIPGVGVDTIPWAIKTAWSNLWNTRAYEERSYYGIDQFSVGMALLTTPNFEDEEANGVAITNNIFDTSGLEPGFYVNVQIDNLEIVQPEPGVIPDAYIHYYYTTGSPVTYISHSTEIPTGENVLTPVQIQELGDALHATHQWFMPVYGNDGEWYGMDTEFKFDDKLDPGNPPTLFMKQARPFPWTPGGAPLSVCD